MLDWTTHEEDYYLKLYTLHERTENLVNKIKGEVMSLGLKEIILLHTVSAGG